MHTIKKLLKPLVDLPEDSRRIALLRASLIGLVAGLAALALEFGAYWLSVLRVHACSIYPAWIVLPCAGLLGGLVSGFLVQKFSPSAYGSGIPQVRAYLLGAKLPLDLKLAFIKLIAGSIALGSGLFMGREGPTVHVGAAIAAHINNWFPTSVERRRQLVAAGAGAGLAAAFNAPIAGVLFVVEELLKDVSTNTVGTAILACFVASALTHIFNAPHMESSHQIQAIGLKFTWHDLLFWLLLGFLSGVFGTLFNRGVLLFLKINREYIKIPVSFRVGLAGLISGAVIAMIPADAHFRDYAALRDLIVAGHTQWYMVPFAFVAFFLLTLIAYGSGAPGGLFAPAIVLGSALGVMVAYLEFYMFGVGSTETMALVGMGAFFAAVARVPITAVVIVTEMTGHYHLVPPLMVASAIACYVGSKMEKGSVYDMLRHYSGLDEEIRRAQEEEIQPRAKDLMKSFGAFLSPTSSNEELSSALIDVSSIGIPVLSGSEFVGFVFAHQALRRAQIVLSDNVTVKDLIEPANVVAKPETTLAELRIMFAENKVETIAVLEDNKLKGLVHRKDVHPHELNDTNESN